MPSTVERTWEGQPGAMGGRRARATFRYRAFLPDPIAALQPVVSFETADLAADAEVAIRALNERASVVLATETSPIRELAARPRQSL